jgi:uncharacterized protein YjdB
LDNKGTLDNQGVVTIKEGGKLTGGGAVAGNPPKYAYIPKAATKETPVPLRDIPGAKTPVEAGTTARLPKSVIFDDGESADVAWTSADPSIAAIDPYGNLIGVKEGKTTLTATAKAGKAKITATALNGEKLTITVSVAAKAIPLKTLTLKKAPHSLKVGKAILLSAKTTPYQATNLKITFSSSDKKILSVDKAGKLTAIKKGTAKITVKANGKKYAKAITVK